MTFKASFSSKLGFYRESAWGNVICVPKSGVMKLQSELLESYFYEDYTDWEKGINEENSRLINESWISGKTFSPKVYP